MGRKAMSEKHKKTKQRERNQKYLSNGDALARAREGNRVRSLERRRGERMTSVGRRRLAVDSVIQADIIRRVSEEEEEEEEGEQCSDDDDDDAFDRNDFCDDGFGGDNWGDRGFGDDGIDDMEGISIHDNHH